MPLIEPYEFMNVIRNVHVVTYSLLPLTLTTKEFSVIRVCLNCKAINKQVIVFTWAKKGKVWFIGKLLPMWKGRTEQRTKSVETSFFFAVGVNVSSRTSCAAHRRPVQLCRVHNGPGNKLFSNKSSHFLLLICFGAAGCLLLGFFFLNTFKGLYFCTQHLKLCS